VLRLPKRVQFGLYLNMAREAKRQALPIALGIALANGKQFDESFFTDFTDRDDMAKLIAFRRGKNGR
jgi:hypothetical protein